MEWTVSNLAEISKYISLTDLFILKAAGTKQNSNSFGESHVTCRIETDRCLRYWRAYCQTKREILKNIEALYVSRLVSIPTTIKIHIPDGIKTVVSEISLIRSKIPDTVEFLCINQIDKQTKFSEKIPKVLVREIPSDYDGDNNLYGDVLRAISPNAKLKPADRCFCVDAVQRHRFVKHRGSGYATCPYCDNIVASIGLENVTPLVAATITSKAGAFSVSELLPETTNLDLEVFHTLGILDVLFENIPETVRFLAVTVCRGNFDMCIESLKRVYDSGTIIALGHDLKRDEEGNRRMIPPEYLNYCHIYSSRVPPAVDQLMKNHPRLYAASGLHARAEVATNII